eukprot:Nitzschia sp. Nitz4//scaffold35_size145790//80590//81817//NITZ4_003032-RA/size145790-augustus-gene-0.120-mRNA-1//1//CDS//3329549130//9262//frame0
MSDLVEQIQVLLDQEDGTYYRTEDYLVPGFQRKRPRFEVSNTTTPMLVHEDKGEPTMTTPICAVWREKIIEWSYQVVDHFEFSRELISIAVNYMDRFLARQVVDKRGFQLLGLTSLYLAIKLNEHRIVTIHDMVALSRGVFCEEEVAQMEKTMLNVLEWRVHPPTAFCFSKHILLLHLQSNQCKSEEAYTDILELTKFLTEISVLDAFFISQKPSDVAMAAFFNSMAMYGISHDKRVEYAQGLSMRTGLNPGSFQVQECQKRLMSLYRRAPHVLETDSVTTTESRQEATSPVCVSKGARDDMTTLHTKRDLPTCPDVSREPVSLCDSA